eukprot:GFUD01084319.1.p1 GENE.GFUD01084319.1~~GFUD01084319.1.p1  ORF type:complete len:320 (+),score=57.43 GFUD01084319.1:50-1009(+)
MGRRSLRSGLVDPPPRSPSPVLEPPPPVKEKKRKRSSHNKPDKENQTTEPAETMFERKRDDGSTSLAILTPGEGVIPGTEKDRPVTLGTFLGKIRNGSASLTGFKEDRRNSAKPMHPIYYPGAYSSHGPTYDSTFANLTAPDSKLVAPYFDFRKLENEELIRNVCGEDYSEHFVDHLLDLFNGKEIEDVQNDTKKTKTVDEDIDFDYLATLEADGIDMSFLSTLQVHYETRQEPEMEGLSIEQQLELTAQLIKNLQSAQNKRLSAPPPPNLTQTPPPSQREAKLAERLVSGLVLLSSQTSPGDLAHTPQVRKAMGVAAF